MSEGEKLTQLTEKITSLDANDLLYVSSDGVSKSIKASTVEAPLKTYADTKASEAQTAAIAAANSSAQSLVNAEVARATAAESNLQDQVTQEVSDRINAFYEVAGVVSIEVNRAIAAESSLQTQISEEVTARQNAISTEETARIAADAETLQSANEYTDTAILNAFEGSTVIPTSAVIMFAGTTPPSGYLLCDGSAVSRTEHNILFSIIGTSYGVGDGSTTFNLPNPDSNANIRLIIKT